MHHHRILIGCKSRLLYIFKSSHLWNSNSNIPKWFHDSLDAVCSIFPFSRQFKLFEQSKYAFTYQHVKSMLNWMVFRWSLGLNTIIQESKPHQMSNKKWGKIYQIIALIIFCRCQPPDAKSTTQIHCHESSNTVIRILTQEIIPLFYKNSRQVQVCLLFWWHMFGNIHVKYTCSCFHHSDA